MMGTNAPQVDLRPLLVVEVGQAHDGSVGAAHAHIDAASAAGADVIKFQTHIASAESTPSEKWRVQFSRQDATRYDYWRRMEFSVDQWLGLREHAHQLGMRFSTSPFSIEAVNLMDSVGVDIWKIASGEVANVELLEGVAATGREVVLSTGMSSLDEIDRAIGTLRPRASSLTLLQCTSQYPCPPETVGLNLIRVLSERYQLPVGLSDHSGDVFAGLAAIAHGATMIEVHLTLSRWAYGPDVSSSLTFEQLCQLRHGMDLIFRMVNSPVSKDGLAESLQETRRLFHRSLVTACAVPAGTVLTSEHLRSKKPGTGLPPTIRHEVVGRKTVRDLPVDHLIGWSDLVEAPR